MTTSRIGILVAGLLLTACTSGEFGGSSDQSAGVGDDGTTDQMESDSAGEGTDADGCDAIACPVPDCPPQRQVTPDGQCCAHCQAPTVCEQGARCDVLDCPGSSTEVSSGCCMCDDVQCESGALPCDDAACVGAEQDAIGNGCCVCGAPLECPMGEAACDTILCDGDVLYQRDGCCRCASEACGAGSTACDQLSCDDTEQAEPVGGGCCVCKAEPKEPPQCADGAAPCELLDCASGVAEVSVGCCQCESSCDAELGRAQCEDIECPGAVSVLPNGCCECQAVECGEGSAVCGALQCPGSEPVEVADGCCECAQCEEPLINCLTIVCAGQVVEVEDGCCTCSAEVSCDEEVQSAYEQRLQELIMDNKPCEVSSDCTNVDLETRCRLHCQVPLHHEAVETVRREISNWAEEACATCPQVDASCESAIEIAPSCIEGRCRNAVQ